VSQIETLAEARLHDGTSIPVAVFGSGPDVLVPVRTEPHPPEQAAAMRQWGADPDLGPAIVEGLAASFRVIAADYEGHRLRVPAAGTLTPENVAHDLLAIAGATRSRSFAYYGYSWLALSGLQLALRTDPAVGPGWLRQRRRGRREDGVARCGSASNGYD
jgi:pimeloyl-ACP methyl ester carboxylesterase